MTILEEIIKKTVQSIDGQGQFNAEFCRRRDDTLKQLKAFADIADKAYKAYEDAPSDYEHASKYYEAFENMWTLRDNIRGEIEALENFDTEQLVSEPEIDAELEYKLCVFGRA